LQLAGAFVVGQEALLEAVARQHLQVGVGEGLVAQRVHIFISEVDA